MAGGFICPGNGHIWMFDIGTSGEDYLDFTSGAKLPGIVSWELSADVEEATAIRTSDTNGVKVKPCGDTTEWNLDLTCAVDPGDWIYSYILKDPGFASNEDGKPLNPGAPISAWLLLTWEDTFATSIASSELASAGTPADARMIGGTDYQGKDNAVYVYGTFNPPGLGVDNDSSDANTSDFSFSIAKGPFLPRTQNARYGWVNQLTSKDIDNWDENSNP